MDVQTVIDQFNTNVREASRMLRKARGLPDDQDIDINEALKLVNRGEETFVLINEIDRLSQLLLDAAQILHQK